MDTLKPRDAKDVEDALQWALGEGKALELGEGKALEIVGQGSKRAIGRPAQTDLTLDLSGLSGVTLYEPEELVLSAKAGTPLAEIGALAANLSGPRRIKTGAARDHFLGFSAVSGRGETFKSGGRVVKNVTGYDLCKLMAGSWGTLGVMTEVTIKVLPRSEAETTIIVCGLDESAAVRAMTTGMSLPCEVSGAAHLPAAAAARIPVGDIIAPARALTVLRLEGVEPSVARRKVALQAALKDFGEIRFCSGIVSRDLWRAIRDVIPFAASRTASDQPLWRISTAPTKGPELGRAIGPAPRPK